jgi:hypothetical protein
MSDPAVNTMFRSYRFEAHRISLPEEPERNSNLEFSPPARATPLQPKKQSRQLDTLYSTGTGLGT